jgi:polyhydroxyalkanoate synthesis repressor PhaR
LAEYDSPQVDAPGTARAPKIIKRYTNRKLYDTVESRYVTLDEIAEMVKAGAEVQIVDNRTKEDLTTVTLAQIIFEEEKKTSKMPLAMLREIIRTGGARLQTFIADEVNPRIGAIREGAEHAVARVLPIKRPDGKDLGAPEAPGAPDEPLCPAKPPREQAKEFVRSSRQSIEEWHRRMEDTIHRTYETVAGLPSMAREVQALRDKLAELERKLEEHEK